MELIIRSYAWLNFVLGHKESLKKHLSCCFIDYNITTFIYLNWRFK